MVRVGQGWRIQFVAWFQAQIFTRNSRSRWPLEDFCISFSEQALLLHLWNSKYVKIKVEVVTILVVHYINSWKKCSDLMQFLKYLAEPFLRPLRLNDVRPLNFEVTTSKICNNFWNFGCQPQKGKADLCMKNGFKVLIYLILISFFLHYLQE